MPAADVEGEKMATERDEKKASRTCSVMGSFVLLLYIASAVYYFYVRVSYTMDVGWMWYARLFLALEILGSASIVGYALILTRRVKKSKKPPTVPRKPYLVRVMIPCYKEDLAIIETTVMAAVEAELPPGCYKQVYLCDDGRDPIKQQWIEEANRRFPDCELHYCRRPRHKGELNGKACNLNYTLRRIYESSSRERAEARQETDGDGNREGPRPSGSSDSSLPVFPLEDEVVAIFDADMVCRPNFFTRTLPVLDDCDMVLTPQWFYNVPMMADIFNHSNLHLWEYMLPAMDGWGCLSCTGTNFVIRANAIKTVGYFPEYTVTEDYALSLELGRHGFNTRYLNEYLAEGEAPDEIPNIFKQRHRWCTGHLQVFFGKKNPLFYENLPFRMRIMYSLGAYSYMCSGFLTPFFLLAPILAIWIGIYPIDLNSFYPVAFTIYYGMTMFTIYYSRSWKHLIFLWFASTANLILWYTYARAILNVLTSFLSCGAQKIVFQATDKSGPKKGGMVPSFSTGSLAGLESIKVETDPASRRPIVSASCGSLVDLTETGSSFHSNDSPTHSSSKNDDEHSKKVVISTPLKDENTDITTPLLSVPERKERGCSCSCQPMKFISNMWIPILTFVLCAGSAVVGIVLGLKEQHTYHLQLVSIIWCAYNAVAPFLVIYYSIFQFRGLKVLSMMLASLSIVALAGVFTSMHYYNRSMYDYKDVISKSLEFYEVQRSGVLPETNRISWREDSGLGDRTPNGSSLVGGYYDAGDTIKYGFPAAFTISFLAWAMIEFPESFRESNQADYLRDTLKWGTDYMMLAHSGKDEFIAQVGIGSEEHKQWGRPEDILRNKERIGIPINTTNPGSDLAGATAAALAASSFVFRASDSDYADKLIKHAIELYEFGKTHKGRYSDQIPDAKATYPSTEFADDLAWGAVWLYWATANETYLWDAKSHIKPLVDASKFPWTTDWDNVGYAVLAVLYKQYPENKEYKQTMDKLMRKWIDDFTYTPKGLAYARDWGVLRESANTAFIAMVYAKYRAQMGANAAEYGAYKCWAMFQIRYMLGDAGRSFVCGVGHKYPERPHHRGASCPDLPAPCGREAESNPGPNPHVLYGALVGGPDRFDHYEDNRTNYVQSEVTLDYNAGFTGALAGLVNMKSIGECYWGMGVFQVFRSVNL